MIKVILIIRDDYVRVDADLDGASNAEISEAIAYLEKLKQELLKHLEWRDMSAEEEKEWIWAEN